jgi:hypothetical protein
MNNNAYLRRGRKLCQHIQRDVQETSMQEDRGDEPGDGGYWSNPGVIIRLPPPLIGFLVMEPSMTTNIFDSTKSIRWVGGIIETWRRKSVPHKPRNRRWGPAHKVDLVSVVPVIRSSYTVESEHQPESGHFQKVPTLG